jgi:3-deoxy-D-manno-octulosonate 8-phosphate phosphatase (KDO 8-P phosphatase)
MDRVVTPGSFGAARLGDAEARQRARNLRLVLTDCDGVLTDGTVLYTSDGELAKRFSLRDGMGVELLRAAGLEAAIVTRERSVIVERRAAKLGMRIFQEVRDKAQVLRLLRAEHGFGAGELAYIGDDVNDLPLLEPLAASGLTAAPADAEPAVLAHAHLRCARPGGQGAFREFADWLLGLRAGLDHLTLHHTATKGGEP